MMGDDQGMMEDDLGIMEDDLEVMEDDLEIMEDDQKCQNRKVHLKLPNHPEGPGNDGR
jgi:hypothetical protein